MVEQNNVSVSRSASFPADTENQTWGAVQVTPTERLYENLEGDEHVALVVGRHWKTLVMPTLFGLFLMLLPIILIAFLSVFVSLSYFLGYAIVFTWFWYCFAFYYAVGVWIKWRSDIYIITNERIIDFNVFGLFYKDVTDIDYSTIHEVTYRTGGILTGWLNFGDIVLKTYNADIVMKNVPMPTKISLAIGELVEVAHVNNPAVAPDGATAGKPPVQPH